MQCVAVPGPSSFELRKLVHPPVQGARLPGLGTRDGEGLVERVVRKLGAVEGFVRLSASCDLECGAACAVLDQAARPVAALRLCWAGEETTTTILRAVRGVGSVELSWPTTTRQREETKARQRAASATELWRQRRWSTSTAYVSHVDRVPHRRVHDFPLLRAPTISLLFFVVSHP